MPGGKRKGAGRPPGSTIDNPRVAKSFRLCREIIVRLKKEKNMTRTIEEALKKYWGL